MPRPITGWHMTGIFVAFFGVIIAVNMTMATLASRTFGGTVVDNSYVASQKFNTWLAEGRAQRKLGWTVKVDLDGARHVRIAGTIPAGSAVTGTATHPLGRVPDQSLVFMATAGGVYLSRNPLPAGRFLIRVKVRAGDRIADFDDQVPA